MREFVIPLGTGLAIFFFGLQVMRIGLAQLSGRRLEQWLSQFTKTPLISFVTGLLSTMLLQSSSAVTVLAIGFVNAKVMRFPQCVGLLLGTNVGTTVTTELLVFPIDAYAVYFVIAGAILWLIPRFKLPFIGLALGGLGCIFLAMDTMESIATPLEESGLIERLSTFHTAEWGMVTGTLLTAVIQSSSAAIALTMGLYHAAAISLPFALAAVLGSNIGTCLTAWIASLGGNREGKQIALTHLLVNVFGVAAFYPLLPSLSEWIAQSGFSPYEQIAHFQTGFNLISSLLLLPFCDRIASIINRLLPA